MPKKSNVCLLRRSRQVIYSRIGDHLIEWWFGPHRWGVWSARLSRAWRQPGIALRPLADAIEVSVVPAKPVASSGGEVPNLPGADYGTWKGTLPTVAGWICDATWAEGGPMGKTRLSLSRDGSEVRAVLQTADFGGLRVECSGPSPDATLRLMESLLKSDKCPWQVDPFPIGQVGRKSKK